MKPDRVAYISDPEYRHRAPDVKRILEFKDSSEITEPKNVSRESDGRLFRIHYNIIEEQINIDPVKVDREIASELHCQIERNSKQDRSLQKDYVVREKEATMSMSHDDYGNRNRLMEDYEGKCLVQMLLTRDKLNSKYLMSYNY